MKKEIENIVNLIEDRQTRKTETARKYKREHAEISARIAELEAAQKAAEDLEAYKAITADLKEQREMLAFLESNRQKYHGSVLTLDEKKAITNTIETEIDDIQNKYAPELIEKLADLIADMDAYTAEIKVLEDLMTQTNLLYSPNFPGCYRKASDIGSKNTDRVEWLQRFVYMYYSYADTARAIASNTTTRAYWGKR